MTGPSTTPEAPTEAESGSAGPPDFDVPLLLERLEAVVDTLEGAQGPASPGSRSVPTGMADFDRLAGGLGGGRLYVVAAMPAAGKTALVLGLAGHVARVEEVPVLFFSLELSGQDLAGRLLVLESGVRMGPVGAMEIAEDDWPEISDAVGRLAQVPLHVVDEPMMTPATIEAMAARAGDGGRCVVVIDSIRHLAAAQSSAEGTPSVGEIAGLLRSMARRLDIPVVMTLPLEPNAEGGPPVELDQLGPIAAEADVIVLIERTVGTGPSSPRTRRATVTILKNRQGWRGQFRLGFSEETGGFTTFGRRAPSRPRDPRSARRRPARPDPGAPQLLVDASGGTDDEEG